MHARPRREAGGVADEVVESRVGVCVEQSLVECRGHGFVEGGGVAWRGEVEQVLYIFNFLYGVQCALVLGMHSLVEKVPAVFSCSMENSRHRCLNQKQV